MGATDRFLIMASDGIWDVVSEEAAQSQVLSTGGEGNLVPVAASLVKKVRCIFRSYIPMCV